MYKTIQGSEAGYMNQISSQMGQIFLTGSTEIYFQYM